MIGYPAVRSSCSRDSNAPESSAPGKFDDFLKTLAGRAFGDQNAFEGGGGTEGFPDRMDSRDRSHYVKGTFMSAHESSPRLRLWKFRTSCISGSVKWLAWPALNRMCCDSGKPVSHARARKSGTGHRLYRRKDVELVLEIKRLLYEKRFTIEGARRFLMTGVRTATPRRRYSCGRSRGGACG